MAVRTAGMINFTTQLDRMFPARRKPDGWIADDNHTGRSDHHPDDTPGSKPGWDGDPDRIPDVRGADISADLDPGVTARAVCDHLARLSGLRTVIRYLIHGGKIWHVNNGFLPVTHTGDPHPTHIHVSFAWTEAADDNTTFNYRFEEIPVALTGADKAWIATEISKAIAATNLAATRVLHGKELDINGDPEQAANMVSLADVVRHIPREHGAMGQAVTRIEEAVTTPAE